MKKVPWSVAFFSAWTMCGCIQSGEVADNECFPLNVGRHWIYAAEGDTVTMTVTGLVELEGKAYARVSTKQQGFDFPRGERRFRCDSTGNVLSCDLEVSIGGEFILPPDFTCSSNIWYKFNASIGEQWFVYGATTRVVNMQPGLCRYAITLDSKEDEVTTPVGSYRAMRFYVEDLCSSDSGYRDWVVPAIGLVKRELAYTPKVYLLIGYETTLNHLETQKTH